MIGKTSSELELRNQLAVDEFYSLEKPEFVIDTAGKLAKNDYPNQFFMYDMQIQNNLIDDAFKSGIEKTYKWFLENINIFKKVKL